jgi:RHS repeat-associated protein
MYSDMYDTANRELHPVQGRWIQPDPAGVGAVDPSNPQSWNRYAYVLNNPLSNIDPTGLYCQWDPDAHGVVTNDSTGDPDTGTQGQCEGLGGTWVPDNGVFTEAYLGIPDNGASTITAQSTACPSGSCDDSNQILITPGQAAAKYCQDHGQLSFNVPFTKIPVTIGLSVTFGPANYSSTSDVSATIPLPVIPWANWLQAGASVDMTLNAPSKPIALAVVGVGRNLSAGKFVTSTGTQGVSLSLGPSIGTPMNVSVPLGNACGSKYSNVE